MLQFWMNVFTKPKDVFAQEKSKATFLEGLKWWVIAGLVVGILSGIISAFVGSVLVGPTGFNIVTFVITIIISLIAYPLLFAIAEGIYFIIAKLLGGTGSFSQQYYLLGLTAVPFLFLTTLLNVIPIVGGIAALLLAIYWLYLRTLAYKEIHGFSTTKAILTWLIPTLIIVVLLIVLFGAILLAFLGMAGAGAAQGGFPRP